MRARAAIRLQLLRLFARVTARESRIPVGPPRRQRVLLLRPDHIGDLLFATPTMRLLRESWPDSRLALGVGPWARAVVQNNPCLDEVHVFDFPGFSRRPKGSLLAPYRLLWKEARRLKTLNFDLVINLRFDFWWGALLAYVADIPWRLGFDVPEVRPFLTASLHYTPGRHEVEQNWKLAQLALGQESNALPGKLEFYPTREDSESASMWLKAQDADGPIICLHPGAGWPVKRWAPDRLAAVADQLVRANQAQAVIIGGPGEEQLVGAIACQMRERAVQATGLSLGAVATILSRAIVAVGTDSGILHLAVAMGTPTVHLFGPVSAKLFGPWGDPRQHAVVMSTRACAPCDRLDFPAAELSDHRCVRDIEPDVVLDAATRVLRHSALGLL